MPRTVMSSESTFAKMNPSMMPTSGGQPGAVMQGEREIGSGETRVQAVREHRARAADPLFRGLADQYKRAGPTIFHFRSVRAVPTNAVMWISWPHACITERFCPCVVFRRNRACKRQTGLLLDRQSVEVRAGPQRDALHRRLPRARGRARAEAGDVHRRAVGLVRCSGLAGRGCGGPAAATKVAAAAASTLSAAAPRARPARSPGRGRRSARTRTRPGGRPPGRGPPAAAPPPGSPPASTTWGRNGAPHHARELVGVRSPASATSRTGERWKSIAWSRWAKAWGCVPASGCSSASTPTARSS